MDHWGLLDRSQALTESTSLLNCDCDCDCDCGGRVGDDTAPAAATNDDDGDSLSSFEGGIGKLLAILDKFRSIDWLIDWLIDWFIQTVEYFMN